MKFTLRHARLAAAICGALYGAAAAHADNLLWDPSQTGTSAGSDGTGTWDQSNAFWYDQTTGSGDVMYPSILATEATTSVTFGNSSSTSSGGGNGSYNVILSAPLTVQNITLGTGANSYYYNIADDQDGNEPLTVAGDIIKASAVGASVFQLSAPLTLTAGNHYIVVNDTPGATPELSFENINTGQNAINGAGAIIVDNSYNGTTNYSSYGTVVFENPNGYTGGTTITNGCLTDNISGALGTGNVVIGSLGNLEFGGNATKQVSSTIVVNNAIEITRNTYSGGNYGDYTDAVSETNSGVANSVLNLDGTLTVDSTDARVGAFTSTVNINNSLVAGPDVTAGTAVLDLDGDYAGIVNLNGNNTAYGAAGNAIEIINGVELNPANDAALGGPGSNLILTGGELHITSALLNSNPAFATNFGGHTIVNNTVGTGVDVDTGLTFTVNGLSGAGVGMRGGGTLDFTGTNTFTGTPYYDGVDDGPGEGTETDTTATGVVNFEAGSSTTQVGLRIRSATVNVAGTLNVGGTYTSIGADSTGSNGTPDYGTVNITGNGAVIENSGDDFNLSDNANTHGTINLSGSGNLTVGGTLYVGKSLGGVGTITMNGSSSLDTSSLVFIGENDGTGVLTQNSGSINLTRNQNFTFVINDGRGGTGAGSGTYNLYGGSFTSAGEVYVGEGGNGNNATWNQTGGTAVLTDWLVFGREGGSGTMNLSGGSLTRTDNSGNIGDENGSQTSVGEGAKTSTLNVTGTGQFVVDTGELYFGNNSGSGVLNLGTQGMTNETASVTVHNWLAVGRNGTSTGVVNLYDGTLTQATNNYFDISGDGGSPTGTVNVYGGTLNAYQMLIGENGSGSATLNISGGNVNLPNNTILANSGTVTGTVNLNGGTLTAYGFQANNGVIGESAGSGAATFVFNGGTLAASTNNTTAFIGAKVKSVVSTGGAIINPEGYSVTIGSALTHNSSLSGADGGLTLAGTGTLTLAGANTYTGLTTVQGATLVLDGSASGTSAQTPVLSGGGANIEAGQVVFNYATSADPVSTIRTLLTSSYNSSNFESGQIYSSNAVPAKYGLGYVDSTANSQVTVMYTLYGDTNLDGTVNFADLLTVAQYYGMSGTDWQEGDFNYDGTTGFADLLLLAQNYGQSLTASQDVELNAISPSFVQSWDLAVAEVSVPEPASLGILGIAGAALLSGRRRRRSR